MTKSRVLGLDYDNLTVGQAAEEIYRLAMAKKGGYVVTPNAEIGESCFNSPKLRDAVAQADFVLPDGAGVVLASKICGHPVIGRTTGVDVTLALLRVMSGVKGRLYLLGAKPGVAQKAADRICEQFPGIVIAGVHHGYFSEDTEVLDEISAARPDILLVGLGAPNQEYFMRRNRDSVSAVMMGIGGCIDILAGEARRAPAVFRDHNLEWFYRLLCEPTRIGRMMRLPKYIIRAFFWKLTGQADNPI